VGLGGNWWHKIDSEEEGRLSTKKNRNFKKRCLSKLQQKSSQFMRKGIGKEVMT